MTDYHTHILPHMDDGSTSLRESLQLLRLEKAQGVDTVALTPHFYPWQEAPRDFLIRREKSLALLEAGLEPGLPQLLPGAETAFFEGISRSEELAGLRLAGTNLLLVEMPFGKWSSRELDELLRLRDRQDITVVLAHAERYLRFQPKALWPRLAREGIGLQANTDSFPRLRTRRAVRAMVNQGLVTHLGSDCHNLTARRPNWDSLPGKISEQFASLPHPIRISDPVSK